MTERLEEKDMVFPTPNKLGQEQVDAEEERLL